MSIRIFLKKTYKVGVQLSQSVFNILKVISLSTLKSTDVVKAEKLSSTCLVLGNGPSIRDSINEITRQSFNTDIMALNFFCLSKEFFDIKPNHYCICDPRIFNSHEGFDLIPDKLEGFIRNLNQITWKCNLYYPNHFDEKFVIHQLTNPSIVKIKYNSTPLEGSSRLSHFFYKRNLGMPTSESVIIPAIFISINLNFNKIYLYGVDHTWAKEIEVDNNNSSSFLLKHFWGDDKRSKSDRSISKFFESQHRLFNSHDQLEIYAKSKDIKIINKTDASLIDSYDRDE